MGVINKKQFAFINSIKPLLDSKEKTIENLFNYLVKNGGDTNAFVWDENSVTKKETYFEFGKEVDEVSKKIYSKFKSLEEGNIIVLQLVNSKFWLVFYYSILKAGFRPFLINPSYDKQETLDLIKDSGAKGIITNLKEDLGIPRFSVEEVLASDALETPYKFQNEIIFCTSGTTGKSKIFVFNGSNLYANLETSYCFPLENDQILYENKNESDRVLCLAPFFHIYGFFSNINWNFSFNSTLYFVSNLSQNTILETIKKHKITHIYFVPLFYDNIAKSIKKHLENLDKKVRSKIEKIINKNLSGKHLMFLEKRILKKVREKILGNSIKYLISGGGPLSQETLELLNGLGYPLYNGFGMTEIGVTSFELSLNIKDRIKNSIGHALKPAEYILEPSSLSPESKELYIKGPMVHIKEIINGKENSFDNSKPFPTGDIASMDTEGRVYIKGRVKDVIISSNGENIYPDEIETYFHNVKNISSYCIFGGVDKSSKKEKVIFAYEVKANISDNDFKMIKDDLEKINRDLNASKKVDEFLLIKEKMPTVNNMKISRSKMKEFYENKEKNFASIKESRHIKSYKNYSEEDVKKLANELREEFNKFLTSKPEKIEDDSHWKNDLGGDSLTYIDLIMDIQKKYEIFIPQEKYGTFTTINDFIIEIIDQKNK